LLYDLWIAHHRVARRRCAASVSSRTTCALSASPTPSSARDPSWYKMAMNKAADMTREEIKAAHGRCEQL
jgi:hypothetical protein